MTTNNAINANQTLATTSSPTFAAVTLTNGINGVTGGTNAGAGYVGQFISSVIPSSSGISFSANTATTLTTINLTAGDWDVMGNVNVSFTGGFEYLAAWASTTATTLPDQSLFNEVASGSTGVNIGMNIPYLRVNVTTTTTVYLSLQGAASSGAVLASGAIYARRVR